jgi:hypothetical protein
VGYNVQAANLDKYSITRKFSTDLSEKDKSIIVKNIIYFYLKSFELTKNLNKIEKINNLQRESMSSFLTKIKILLS